MRRFAASLLTVMLVAVVALSAGCRSKYYIRDVDPERPDARRVRALGPESQDVITVADRMVRSLLENDTVQSHRNPPTIVMLPMVNNTRHAMNQEVFTTLLKARLNQEARDQLVFVSRDISEDIALEREMKRTGQVDYDPELRAMVPAGGDYFLRGRADGLANVSTRGQSDFIIYSFKLVDAETGIEVWEDYYQTMREGRDDVIYR